MTRHTRVRLLLPAGWLVLGCALVLAAYAGNMVGLSHGLALVTVVGGMAIVLVGRTGSDLGAVLRADRDERQRSLDVRARGIAALTVFVVCAALAARWYSNGHSQLGQPYLLVCIIEVLAYLISLLSLTFRQNATAKHVAT
ncbi:MAG TPA: hypothetical protein VK771_04585 [Acidimicrobiia bacterium]|nr:hypothetical protein [Acidimicrobiia bacterium]